MAEQAQTSCVKRLCAGQTETLFAKSSQNKRIGNSTVQKPTPFSFILFAFQFET
jgi:hypothetical protein